MAILTVDDLREHIETSLGEAALQRLLDGTEALIVARAGAAGSTTELVDGGYRLLTLSRPLGSVTSIVERYTDDDQLTLSATANDDYLIWPGGTVIERLTGGTNSRRTWHGRVLVTYTPADDDDLRALAQLALIKLEMAFTPGLAMTVIGSWTEQYLQGKSYDEQREEILATLDPQPTMRVIG
jgi:hypothetical protein